MDSQGLTPFHLPTGPSLSRRNPCAFPLPPHAPSKMIFMPGMDFPEAYPIPFASSLKGTKPKSPWRILCQSYEQEAGIFTATCGLRPGIFRVLGNGRSGTSYRRSSSSSPRPSRGATVCSIGKLKPWPFSQIPRDKGSAPLPPSIDLVIHLMQEFPPCPLRRRPSLIELQSGPGAVLVDPREET